jgi:hypothetical protein
VPGSMDRKGEEEFFFFLIKDGIFYPFSLLYNYESGTS